MHRIEVSYIFEGDILCKSIIMYCGADIKKKKKNQFYGAGVLNFMLTRLAELHTQEAHSEA